MLFACKEPFSLEVKNLELVIGLYTFLFAFQSTFPDIVISSVSAVTFLKSKSLRHWHKLINEGNNDFPSSVQEEEKKKGWGKA